MKVGVRVRFRARVRVRTRVIICGSRIMLISHIYQGQYQVLTSILKGTDVVVDESGS